jgi:hypothetical protein
MNRKPTYASNVAKAHEVILWLAHRSPHIDIYHLVKAAFFADKHHVVHYGRPIIGDKYEAAAWGPLPRVIYGLLRCEPIEMLALGTNSGVQFTVDETYRVTGARPPNLRMLSESDQESLAIGEEHVRGRSFDDIYRETHADPAYILAQGGMIDYRDMVPQDDPLRAQKRDYIAENAEDAAI